MKTDLKIPIQVNHLLVVQYSQVAQILGIPLARYVESYLRALLDDLGLDPVQHVANELFYESYRSHRLAAAAAEKLEAYAIDEKLKGNSTASTITTEVIEYQPGFWRVKVHYLAKAGWKIVAADLWGEDDDDESESDWWKEA